MWAVFFFLFHNYCSGSHYSAVHGVQNAKVHFRYVTVTKVWSKQSHSFGS